MTEPHIVRTMEEVYALPTSTILRTPGGWANVLQPVEEDHQRQGLRLAHMSGLDGVRCLWSTHLPAEVVWMPPPHADQEG